MAQGRDGEAQLARLLPDLLDWRVLSDRDWPGTKQANIDLLLVGPGGVYIVDVKDWVNPRIEGGRLWCGAVLTDDVDKLAHQTETVENR